MTKNYTSLFAVFLFLACLLNFNAYGQQIQSIPDKYYFNNFDGGQIGSAFTQLGASPSLIISGQSTNNLATATGYCLTSTVNTNANNGYNLAFIQPGTSLNDEQYGFEWTFLYKNTGGNPDNSDVVGGVSENSWKYWFLAENSNLLTAKGYFITQVGSTLYLRYRYDNSSDASHYNELIAFDLSTIGGNNKTYAIRVQRLKRGGQFVWHMFVDPYTSTSKEGATERGGTGAYNDDLGTYANSSLLCSSTSTGRFMFDEMKMYSMKLEISGANETSNGLSNPLFAGQTNAILYGLRLETRGLFDMYQIRFELEGGITSIVQSGTMKLMKSADNFYGSSDDIYITDLDFYDGAVQKYGFADRFYSIGKNDGSNVTVGYYYIQANIRSDASLSNNFTFVGAPVLQSESAQINYVSTGSVTNTVAPETGSGVLYDWLGGTNSWHTASNWSPAGIPGVKDIARIGVTTFTNQPTVTASTSVGNLTIGTTKAVTLTVNGTLSVISTITQQNAANADITTTIAGSGTLEAANFIVGNRTEGTTTANNPNTTLVDVTLNNITLSESLILNGIYKAISSGSRINNSGIRINSGKTLTVNEIRSLNADPVNISSIYLNGSTLKLTGKTPFSELSEIGNTYVLTPTSGTSTIEYSNDADQVIYPAAAYFGDNMFGTTASNGYSAVKFSGTGKKTFAAGTLNIKRSWDSEGGKIDLLTNGAVVNFNGAAQTITDAGSDNGNGVFFKNVTFSGGNTKTLAGAGKFSVTTGGTLNVAAGTTLAAAGKLYLKSDASGFASVAPLTTGVISGDVNDEIFFTGGAGKRGTRLITPSINDNLLPTGSKYLQQLKHWMVITGPGEEEMGFDPGNSAVSEATTLTTYNEPATMASATAQYIKISNLNNGTVPLVKPGSGVYLFYRGDRSNYSAANSNNSLKLKADYVPESFSPVFTGTLNQGAVAAAITNTNNSGDNYNGYNLVGNPYAGTIDFEKVYTANSSNIANEIRIILPGGGMMTRKKVGGIVSVINAGDALASQYIQPGQAFYIRKTTVGSGNLNFTEANKADAGANPDRLLTLPAQKGLFASLKMGLSNDPSVTATDNTAISLYFNLKDAVNTDEAVIIFKEGFESNFDTNDAPYLSGSTVALSSLSDDSKLLAMNYMPAINTVQQVKLSVTAAASGPLSLNFTNTEALGRFKITLKDNYLNTTTDLKANPVYSFNVDNTIAESRGTERFVLLFEEGPALNINLSAFTATQQDAAVAVKWTTVTEESSVKFEIERSADGVNFGKIGEVAGAGNSYTTKPYTYMDEVPLAGLNYYRLKQVYTDETSAYSEIASVTYTKPIMINLEVFTATKQNTTIDLNWTTVSEEKSVRFEVERGADGVTFAKIGEVAGAGNSAISIAYAFTDTDPLTGENNYRLRQIYTDGSFSYSEIRTLDYTKPVPVSLTAFTAAKQGDAIALNWISATETNSVRFEIERAVGNPAFVKIGENAAAGNSNAQTTYAFNDVNPVDGSNNYRLKLVYGDGTFSYSEVRSVIYNKPAHINLTLFTAERDGSHVVLKFVTATEENSQTFEIERSADGITFTKIDELPAAGNSQTSKTYSLLDEQPLKGVNYYRIKQVNINQEFDYSDKKEVNFVYDIAYGLSNLRVYPNPSSESIEVNIENVPAKLTIYSLAGKSLKTTIFAAGEPIKQKISDLSNGMYILEIKNTADNTILGTAKFFKQ